ncbi:1,4-dihydroxy-2-naphthoate polyprenyltransferase [Fusibacter ferrireducens]|uniref:1,4-dihydroxy-2-naphthoate polyprenyltransferase n=1 Tax=Fusibacter ferrireducens TaxID=2785058 RepID=A0ABR9ZVV4_9FIRM|nr:1,4-dihydroxy-2-naphthoate polyprenyltransferase [Fusibacter ferrireducens]MBF4694293.1 1,4-dihydroxy-2-naphthoate polyprenyltransferase [Fusibacter ferrireducens]
MKKLQLEKIKFEKLKSFLDLVEIRTKAASVFPFFVGTLYAITRYHMFNLANALLMFFSLLMIDMATTTGNHYMDYKKAVLKEGFHYDAHNPISKALYTEEHAKAVIIALVSGATFLGVILAVQTDWIVLWIGMFSFLVGLLYSFGPVPISRTPLGEAVSGFFMGIVIVGLSTYIHIVPLGIVTYKLTLNEAVIFLNWREIINIVVVGLPMMFLISNIMLANNTCDMAEDEINKRMTLPILIGEQQATKLYLWAVYGAYASIVLGIMIDALPPIQVASLATFPVVRAKSWEFVEHPVKSNTFILAVKNFVLFSSIYILGFLLYAVQQIL